MYNETRDVDTCEHQHLLLKTETFQYIRVYS
jgi:hypothetical protein